MKLLYFMVQMFLAFPGKKTCIKFLTEEVPFLVFLKKKNGVHSEPFSSGVC